MATEYNGVTLMEDIEEGGQIRRTGWQVLDLPLQTLDDTRKALTGAKFEELAAPQPGVYVTPFHVEGFKAFTEKPFYHLPGKTFDETHLALLDAGFIARLLGHAHC